MSAKSRNRPTGAVNVPIFATSTYRQEALGRHKGYEYARTANPTRTALETCIADLENGGLARAYASGMAATATVLDPLGAGLACHRQRRLLRRNAARYGERPEPDGGGLALSVVDLNDEAALKAALRPETRMIWVETPTNPLLKIVDLARIGRVCQGARAHQRPATTPSARPLCSVRWITALIL